MDKRLLDYFNGDDLAASTWLSKYALEGELTPDDMHKRLAKEFARVELGYEYLTYYDAEQLNSLSEYGKNRVDLTEESIYKLFKDFKYIIPQGSIMSQLGNPSIGSLSNCFVIGQPEDSYGGIFEKDEQMAQLMKRRGGVGIDISTLRPEGTITTNAAKTSTGAVSFMNRFSNTTREVAQNGRRGALMISININHPDVLDFIKIKRDLTKITGANVSIKVGDGFMKAVENDEDYILRFPCDFDIPDNITLDLEYNKLIELDDTNTIKYNNEGEKVFEGLNVYVRKVKAKEYWDEIIKSAHNVAEAGLIFEDNHIDYSPDGLYPQYKGVTTNPCGEIFMQPFDACRLIAINLFSFVENPFGDSAKFNLEKFYKYTYEAMRLSDDLIDLELEHIDRIIDKINSDLESDEVKGRELRLWNKIKDTATASRRTGLGFTALGDALAALGLGYDSDKGVETIELIMSTKMEAELDCTTDLAILRGTFDGWDFDLESNYKTRNRFYEFVKTKFNDKYLKMLEYGRRNVSWSTVAPTGTVSLLAQTTSGIEPLFQPFYIRRRKVNSDEERVDFTDDSGDKWTEFPVLHPKFKSWIRSLYNGGITSTNKVLNKNVTDLPLKGEVLESFIADLDSKQLQLLFIASPWYKSTANDIDWRKRVEIQGIIQKYTTHSISSTINLPEDVTEAEVSDIYLHSWRESLKGITVYRDGSRAGVLVKESKPKEEFDYQDALKRPKTLNADWHTTTVKGTKYNVVVGLFNNKAYEIFMFPYIKDLSSGTLSKAGRGVYIYKDTEKGVSVRGLTSIMSDEEEAITRLISTSLRHGADIKFIVEQLNKTSGDLFSFTKGLARILKRYIPKGAKSTVSCLECSSDNVIFEEGCSKCLDCGSSKCG